MRRPSIRKRLIVWTTLLTTLILVIGGWALYSSVKQSLYEHFDRLLDEGATVVMIEVEVKNSKVYHEWQDALEANSLRRTNTLIQVWDQKSDATERSPALGNYDLQRRYGALNERVFYDLKLPNGERGRAVGVLIYPNLEHPEVDVDFVVEDHPQIFVWAQSSSEIRGILQKSKRRFILGVSTVILLLWIVIWIVTTRLLRPINEVTSEIQARKGSEIGQAMIVPDGLPSEVAGMAETFNELLSKIDVSREKDRDFFLNVAHEMRTPLAGVHSIIEQALRKPRDPEDYRRRFEKALQGSTGLRNLVSRLLKVGRIKKAGENPDWSCVDAHQVLRQIWHDLSGKARARDLEIAWSLTEDGHLESDLELVKVIGANLLDNAASYARKGSLVKVETFWDSTSFLIRVENQVEGDWFSPEELASFFDPFYRRDQARVLQDDHAGIGLSFCRDVMEILGGEISVNQPESHRVVFEVSFPIIPRKASK